MLPGLAYAFDCFCDHPFHRFRCPKQNINLLAAAIQANDLASLQMSLNDSQLPVIVINQALVAAIFSGHHSPIKALLQDGRSDPEAALPIVFRLVGWTISLRLSSFRTTLKG